MKVAIVGSGTAGLGAAWALNKFSEHDVHVLEADARWGGHANTVQLRKPGGTAHATHKVDTGFIVYVGFAPTRCQTALGPADM